MRLDPEKVRRARESLGYSIETTGEKGDLSPNSVLRAEHGEEIRPSTARRLARALGTEVVDLYPKGEAPTSTEPSFNDVLEEERRADEFMIQRPSDAERIWFIEKAIDILRHYHELGQRVRAKMGEDLEWHGTGYVWHGYYFYALQPVMERDGVLLHASFVMDGPAKVSERERTACEKLRNYDLEMQNLVWDMRTVDEENNARVREEGSRGVAEAFEWLKRDISDSVPGRRGQ